MNNRKRPVRAELTADQVKALDTYIQATGERWKDQLAHDWSRAGTRVHGVEYAYLHQLRNWYGPSWLDTYEHEKPAPNGWGTITV